MAQAANNKEGDKGKVMALIAKPGDMSECMNGG